MHALLSYCLDNIPKSYDTTYPITEFSQGERGVLEVTITQKRFHNNILFIESFCKDFNSPLRIIIFNARPYHAQIFQETKTLFVLGTLEFQHDKMTNALTPTFVNPKIPRTTNTITMQFKTRTTKLADLQKHITKEALENTHIPQQYSDKLYRIFHPDLEFFKEYSKEKALPESFQEALKFIEIFVYTQRLRKKKTQFRSKLRCNGDLESFLKTLPFSLTNAQKEAIKDIQEDLKSEFACRRIVMGDVGCGKTMVILASVILAYPQKSILMAPTTILAKQLFEEAKKYLPKHINISFVSSSNAKERKKPLEGDFIIGTHALLYRSGDLADFALVMTDEQHRFGTNARSKLEQMLEGKDEHGRTKPHNIQFSATPIPRTMAMLKNNVVSFSFIKELPFKKDIDTRIIDKSGFQRLIEHIRTELTKGHQIAIIYPRIEEADESKEKLIKDSRYTPIPYMSLKDAENYWIKHFQHVFSTHGKDKEKEDVLEQFANTESAILLATTMIEVGISLPKLSIIVIVGAERLGLASLHQLRGRVSRNGLKGYCYLYTHQIQNERLIRFSKTLNGFDIAELDLEYRNSGDLLDGILQSGAQFRYFDFATDSKILEEANVFLNRIS